MQRLGIINQLLLLQATARVASPPVSQKWHVPSKRPVVPKSQNHQRLAEHKGQGEKEDKDEEPLPIEQKGTSKDIEDRSDAWAKHFYNNYHKDEKKPEGEQAFKAHVETQKGDQIEEKLDKRFAGTPKLTKNINNT